MYLNNRDLAKAYQDQLLHAAKPGPPGDGSPEGAKLVLVAFGAAAVFTTVAGVLLALLTRMS
jgi:hypothetical protein